MNIMITCRHMDLTPNLKQYAEDKIGKFNKYLGNVSEATVTLSVEKYRHKAEVTLKVNGASIQAESTTGELYSSIDEVVEKLAKQVRKYKEKHSSHRKGKGKPTVKQSTEQVPPAIIKNRSYDLKPMAVEEAAMQMDLMDSQFFVFTNASSGDMNVLYKQGDGTFGLIEPIK